MGDKVERDEPLFEISTDKVDAEIPSPVAGVLTEIKVQPGETVPINTVVAVIGDSAGDAKAAPKAAPAEEKPAPEAKKAEAPKAAPAAAAKTAPAAAKAAPRGRARVPGRATTHQELAGGPQESLRSTTSTLVSWRAQASAAGSPRRTFWATSTGAARRRQPGLGAGGQGPHGRAFAGGPRHRT